ncbi:O-antigen ligase family protein [Chitinophaga cymbidii]|uniref:O-antigen ligase-related domain-containing protein n=1 Tax=Chitinophaga cymbidii TaxID=1096750 RepID=A0A512RRM9_9BACT|nr:O-antigen ligase family protein [Chitinophaga cymbidii]GEP98358.1 hypothetical protein CCY01nite_46180 [Chitinophaga cymbidii]
MSNALKYTIRFTTYLLWALMIPGVAYLASLDFKISVALVGGIVGLGVVALCLLNFKLGYYIYITITLILPMLEKLYGTQISGGVVMDLLLLCTLAGSIFDQRKTGIKKIQWGKDPYLICTYLYILALMIQIANPYGANIFAWLFFMRVVLRAYIFLYLGLRVFSNREDVKTFFKYWLTICTLAAIYACIQQHYALLPFERAFAAKYPELFKTTIILAGIRIFSFMSDAAAFGIIMACNIVVIAILLTAKFATIGISRKLLLLVSLALHFLALGYSGTRTGYVMVPVGMMLFFLANMQKRNTILIAMGASLVALVILFGPFHGNPTIVRVRTAFLGKKQDASMDVRDENRHKVQPYIYSHPIGGGVMTTGVNSLKFHRGHQNANVQTDNGYLRAALETGWLGVLMLVAQFFFLIRMGVRNFFRLENELDKLFMIGIAAAIFEISLAQYTQEASTLIESSIMYNAFIAILLKMKYLYTLNA